MNPLPNYVVATDLSNPPIILTAIAKDIEFPLSSEDFNIISQLEAKFDAQEKCAGLAAPQIGYSKRAIVFAVPDDAELKKWRPDLVETMPKTLWINPEYQGIGTETHVDYEACFSVGDFAGPVERFKSIHYKAYLIDGSKVEGIANGFLARLIQHEIDHLNGRLFSELVPKGQLIPIAEYRKMREERIKAETTK